MSFSSDSKVRCHDRVAVIILCGGKSSRIGYAKWRLPFGDERMLDRILRVTHEISETQIVVASRDQQIDGVPKSVRIAFDEQTDRGPLQGIHAGMASLPPTVDAAFVTWRSGSAGNAAVYRLDNVSRRRPAAGDRVCDFTKLLIGELASANVFINPGLIENLCRGSATNSVNVGKRSLDALLVRDFDSK